MCIFSIVIIKYNILLKIVLFRIICILLNVFTNEVNCFCCLFKCIWTVLKKVGLILGKVLIKNQFIFIKFYNKSITN